MCTLRSGDDLGLRFRFGFRFGLGDDAQAGKETFLKPLSKGLIGMTAQVGLASPGTHSPDEPEASFWWERYRPRASAPSGLI